MKKLTVLAYMCLSFSLLQIINAQEDQESTFDKIWDNVVLYENDENSLVSKFWLTGRLQGEYHSFENEVAPAIDHDDYDWRRFRFGFKATLFGDITLHSEADFGLENRGKPLYNRLTDTYFSWSTESSVKFKIGKQSAPFTLDGSTSSKKLHTLERSKIAGNVWFGQEYFPGISVSGSMNEIDYFAGIYSNDDDDEFYGTFKHGQFGLISLGKDYAENFNLEKSYFRLDFMLHEDSDDGFRVDDWSGAYSFVTKWENNDWYFWTDLSFADRKNGDVWGIQLMPFYDITDKTQAIFCYTHLNSAGDNQLRASRWEDRLDRGEFRGDDLTEYFFGLNHFFYGHKLKWQNGIQYTALDEADGSKEYEGWGFTTAFRISW